jgi:hypothetical protein
MKVRTSIIAAGAAVVLGTTWALALPAVASAHSTTTTLKFISVEKASVFFGKTALAQQDTDVNAKGKTVGYDELYVAFISATTGNVNITGDASGGMLYGTGTINLKTGAFSNGKVTGGTGSFTGATGTITTKAISKTKTAITIKYST